MGPSQKPRVLVLCTGNSARSQMAEGLLRALSRGAVEVSSAGTRPVGIHPLAVEVMKEAGIDISAQRSKSVEEFGREAFDAVITVCDNAREHCPVFPGAPERIHFSLADPAALDGTREEKLEAFRRTRDALAAHLRKYLETRRS